MRADSCSSPHADRTGFRTCVGEQCHSLGAVARAFPGRRLFDEGARGGLGDEVGHIDRVIVDAEHERGVLFEERGDVGAGPGQALGAGQIAVVLKSTRRRLRRSIAVLLVS